MAKVVYTTIIFATRDILNISNTEYIFCDQVHKLSKDGWCKAKQEFLAKNLGISDRSVRSMANRLIEFGLIEQGATGKYKTTDKWYNTAVLENVEETSAFENRKKLPMNVEETSDEKRKKLPIKAEETSLTKENKYKINSLKLKENPDEFDLGDSHATEPKSQKRLNGKDAMKSFLDRNDEVFKKFDNPALFFENWELWLCYKNEIKKSFKSEKSERIGLKQLSEFSNCTTSTAIKIIETSIASGWQGLFAFKSKPFEPQPLPENKEIKDASDERKLYEKIRERLTIRECTDEQILILIKYEPNNQEIAKQVGIRKERGIWTL